MSGSSANRNAARLAHATVLNGNGRASGLRTVGKELEAEQGRYEDRCDHVVSGGAVREKHLAQIDAVVVERGVGAGAAAAVVNKRNTLNLGADWKQSVDNAGESYDVAYVSGGADWIADAYELRG